MNSDLKEQLALTGDSSKEAMASRLRAARVMTGTSQSELGKVVGVRVSAISNMENARSFVSHDVMKHFHREHRLDFNFFIAGLYSQLPSDVQIAIFSALADVAQTTDPEGRSS